MTFHSKNFVESVHLYCDGAWTRNRSAVGFIIYDQSYRLQARMGFVVDATTSNSAEYLALIHALDEAAAHTRREVLCFFDSEIVLGQLKGIFRLRSVRLRRYYHRVKDLERPFEKVIYCGVRRNDQRLRLAHQLAHNALNGRGFADANR